MDIIAQKKLLRKEFKQKRASLINQEFEEKSKKICANFINDLFPKIYSKYGKNFSLYLSANNEVETAPIKDFFQKNNIIFSYPKIVDSNSELEFIEFEASQKFVKNVFFEKILEPENGKKILPDILIIPLLAFDDNLQRLGMGGGFFDRTIFSLKKQNPQLIVIGLAYELQRFAGFLPIENSDCALDFIITEAGVFFKE